MASDGASTSSSSTTTTGVDIETDNGRRLHFIWTNEVNSTQDSMRSFLTSEGSKAVLETADVVALGAAAQTRGRGTSGRSWVGMEGNAFVTVAVKRSDIHFTLTLLPLRVGILVARQVSKLIPDGDKKVSLKWPNDVLVGDDKVSGLLIEMEGDRFLVGIGVNVAKSPQVPQQGPNRGRTATCLADHGLDGSPYMVARSLSESIARSITQWTGEREDGPDRLLQEWSTMARWGREYKIRDTGEVVFPLSLESDGRLLVRDQQGRVKTLMVDYLY